MASLFLLVHAVIGRHVRERAMLKGMVKEWATLSHVVPRLPQKHVVDHPKALNVKRVPPLPRLMSIGEQKFLEFVRECHHVPS
jgi:hypothetical protein